MVATTSSFTFAESLTGKSVSGSNSEIKKENKIIGGTKAPLGAWPSTVALLSAEKLGRGNYHAQFCSGTIIASKWVLTAAHCVVDSDTGALDEASSIKVLVDTSDLGRGGRRENIRRIIVHPNYYYQSGDADIALLELEYDSGIMTIPVSGDDAPIGLLATVVGWGATDKDAKYFPEDLQEVEVPIVSKSICEDIYGTTEFTQNMICAGYSQGAKDTCKSDSGGPLMGIQYGEYVQVGITSWGVGCAQPGHYGVYTRLSQFDGWINYYTRNSSNRGGGYESWSRFYSGEDSGGSLFFLLFPLSLLLLRRKIKGAV
ncbi:MAG: serine protease [Cocleimonas sp.]|nr:serine protease [Cocleimonas sp.]